jgi:glycosyltransferase involved in cell wall biosynthesis
MAFLHVAPLAYEAGGVQQLLHSVAVHRHEPIFNVSDSIENRFADRSPRPRIVAAPPWSRGLRLPGRLAMRWHARQHQGALAWDDVSTWKKIARHSSDAILYDHGVSMRNVGHRDVSAAWRRVCHVITCSVAQANHLQSTWTTEANIEVCPNGLPADFPVPAELPVRPDLEGRRVRIGMVGRLSFEKGHGAMLHALKHLRSMGMDAELVVVGTGPLGPAISALAETLGLGEHVLLPGYSQVPSRLYPHLDLVCLPSLWESFGLVAIEAGAYGCPVVAADRGGLAEASGSGGLLVKPTLSLAAYRELVPSFAGDQQRTRLAITSEEDEPCALAPAELAASIMRLVSSGSTYQSLSRQGFHRATTQFTFDAYLRRLSYMLDSA